MSLGIVVPQRFPCLSHQDLPPMAPYLKGFHLLIEMWRGGRDCKGWKVKPPKEEAADQEEEDDWLVTSLNSLDSLDFIRTAA